MVKDNEITMTVFGGVTSREGEEWSYTPENWANVFSDFQVAPRPKDHLLSMDPKERAELLDRDKKKCKLFLPGVLKEGTTRRKKNVAHITALAADLDDISVNDFSECLKAIQEFYYVCYTTHKHGLKHGAVRARVVIFLAEPIPAENFTEVWEGLNVLLKEKIDPQTKNIDRLSFFPSTYDKNVAEARTNKGRLLDWKTDLPKAVFEKRITASSESYRPGEPSPHAVIHSLRSRKNTDEYKELTYNLSMGLPICEQGGRHNAWLSLTMTIAQQFGEISRELFDDVFEPSVEATIEAHGEGDSLNAVYKMYTDALDKLQENKEAALELQAEGDMLSDEELSGLCALHGCTIDELLRRLIVQAGNTYFVMDRSGEYKGPKSKDAAAVLARQTLRYFPVEIQYYTKSGQRKWIPFIDMCTDFGEQAENFEMSYVASRSYYHKKTETMVQRAGKVRKDIVPRYVTEVDEFLRILAGDKYEKLVDWLSVVTDTHTQNCALYLEGEPNCGKGFLVNGLANIWEKRAFVNGNSMLGAGFNSKLGDTPLIFFDEEVRTNHINSSPLEELKAMITATTHDFSKKFVDMAVLRGCVRIVLAANHKKMLCDKHSDVGQTLQSQKAIAQRFLHVPIVGCLPELYLKKFPKRQRIEIMEEGIPAHCLYLRDNHVIQEPGDRFPVEGVLSEMTDFLAIQGYWTDMVCAWLCDYLNNPNKFHNDAKVSQKIRCGNGQFLVMPGAVRSSWSDYGNVHKKPTPEQISSAIERISTPDDVVPNGFCSINVRLLMTWAKERKHDSVDKLLAVINGPIVTTEFGRQNGGVA